MVSRDQWSRLTCFIQNLQRRDTHSPFSRGLVKQLIRLIPCASNGSERAPRLRPHWSAAISQAPQNS